MWLITISCFLLLLSAVRPTTLLYSLRELTLGARWIAVSSTEAILVIIIIVNRKILHYYMYILRDIIYIYNLYNVCTMYYTFIPQYYMYIKR